MTRLFATFAFVFLMIFALGSPVFAQSFRTASPTPQVGPTISPLPEEALSATRSAEEQEKLDQIKKEDITIPEEPVEKQEVFELFSRRPIGSLQFYNFGGYIVQNAVRVGVPANTIILILLLPFLATTVAFMRHIVGLPSLEMIVPVALSITLVSTGFTAGAVLLLTILLASTIARVILKKVRIMQFPKMALSIFVVAIFVFASLVLSARFGMLSVKQISIFPILILILLGEKIVSLQLTRSARETFMITVVTLILGLVGFFLLSWQLFRQAVILYPELILLLIPINIMIGRYFGLRLTEFIRFYALRRDGGK